MIGASLAKLPPFEVSTSARRRPRESRVFSSDSSQLGTGVHQVEAAFKSEKQAHRVLEQKKQQVQAFSESVNYQVHQVVEEATRQSKVIEPLHSRRQQVLRVEFDSDQARL